MEPIQALALRSLLENQQVAALATVHKAEPAVSMVPYALLPQGKGFVIHVSRLATHTADMLSNPAVGLLVTAPTAVATSPQELPRASVQGKAQPWAHDSPAYAQARASLFDYLEVFYNRQRRHSTINYEASLAFEAAQTAS